MLLLVLAITFILHSVSCDECHLTPVIHVLEHPGCISKPIPSFACTGQCTSYVQVSGSKFWLTERSCMCCQESGERKAVVDLFCPNSSPGQPKVRKVTTKAPSDCMCRPCTAIEQGTVLASDIAGYIDSVGPMMNSLVSYQ
ncbi:bursicon [Lepeophtheirus salmonis]|uniref:bursicon n=1 Tax=Lepeophtheirus salmonis TaxID=72036 RepID=UPI001AE91BC9|nr:bursicon-like [Lepeophtheirus salmonis]